MKRFIKFIIISIIVGFTVISCENSNPDSFQSNLRSVRTSYHDEVPVYEENTPIILGAQRNNPYEISNMQAAWEMLADIRGNFLVGAEYPEVNMIYYRVLPTDTAELALLSADTTVMYFDYPLDYEIEQWGSYYHDPTVTDTLYTWLYAVVPYNHPLPELPTLEILQECYLPNEEDIESIPDWQNGYALLEYVAYRESGNDDMFDSNDAMMLENILSYSPRGIEHNEPRRNNNQRSSGFWEQLWGFICGAYPEGDFSVRNTYTNTEEGIKNAEVFIHNFIKMYCGPLDGNGHYLSAIRFRTKSWYHIRFENHHTKTRIYGGIKFLLGPVHVHLGWHPRDGYDYTLEFNHVGWRYAAVNNGIETYYNYCQEYSILFPYNMRVWVVGGMDNWVGSTPLFHKTHSPIVYNDLLMPILAPFEIPDMCLFISHEDYDFQTPELYEVVFHEFSHASHYEQVGNIYWMAYVLHIIANQGYGGQYDENSLAGYCGIGEMWGNFAGSCFLYKYLGYSSPYIYITAHGLFDIAMYSGLTPQITFHPYADWFHSGILAKIHQDSGCSISDIYNALNADVYSLDALKNSLINQGIADWIIEDAYRLYDYWN